MNDNVSGPVFAKNIEIEVGIIEIRGVNDQEISISLPTTPTLDRFGDLRINAPIEVPPEQAAEILVIRLMNFI